MKKNLLTISICLCFVAILLMSGCTTDQNSSEGDQNNEDDSTDDGDGDTYDVDVNGIPKFADVDYTQLGDIYRISKFRSSEGHDYSDNFESCRSMKHYFRLKGSVDWVNIKIFSPINGTVFMIWEEDQAGRQLRIKSEQYPAFYFIIFHVNLTNPLNVGDNVTAGQELGTHAYHGSDIAIGINTPGGGWKLVSYFNVMTDSLFQDYQDRGIASRSDLIITEEERDANPLTCDGEDFVGDDPLGDQYQWVILN